MSFIFEKSFDEIASAAGNPPVLYFLYTDQINFHHLVNVIFEVSGFFYVFESRR